MTTWAIIPIKHCQDEQKISEALEQKLELLNTIPQITRTVVVSPDAKSLSIARRHGARTVHIAEHPLQASAVSRVLQLAAAEGAWRALLVHPNTPLYDPYFVEQLLSQRQPQYSVTLVPLPEMEDTGLALISPPDYVPLTLGEGSFQTNLRKARSAHVTVVTHYTYDFTAY